MSFKLISIVFIPLAITHQCLCGQNMSLVTYIYLSQTYRVRSVVIVLAVRSAYPYSFDPLPVNYMFRYTLNSLHYVVSAVFSVCTQHSSSV